MLEHRLIELIGHISGSAFGGKADISLTFPNVPY
jgi:hypothetical protein